MNVSDMRAQVRTFVSSLTPFKVAVAAFVTMFLVSAAIMIASIYALSEIKYAKHQAAEQQANAAIQANSQGVAKSVALAAASTGIMVSKTRHFLNNQVGILILAAISLVISIAGTISGSVVIDEVMAQSEGKEGVESGTTTQDYKWISSFGSIVLLQGIILMVIAIFMTVQYEHLMQTTPLHTSLSPDEKKQKGVMMAQLILGYIGLLGGIVYYATMRIAK